jgi:hypothetical protein
MDLPATYQEAQAQGLKIYPARKPCKHGHIALRYASNRACVKCVEDKQATE